MRCVSSYEMAPALAAVSSMVQADGITAVVEQTTTMQATESAMDTRYDGFVAASTLAGVAVDQARPPRPRPWHCRPRPGRPATPPAGQPRRRPPRRRPSP